MMMMMMVIRARYLALKNSPLPIASATIFRPLIIPDAATYVKIG